MTPTKTKSRSARAKRVEATINLTARFVGYAAVVFMIAAVFRVMIERLWEGPRVDAAYIESIYDDQMDRRWSGNAGERPPLVRGQGLQHRSVTPELPFASSPSATEKPVVEAPSVVEAPGIGDIESKKDKIEQTVRSFFEASTVAEKIKFARDPGRVQPLMEAYYRANPFPKLKWRALGWVLPVQEPGYSLGYAQAMFDDSDPVSVIVEEASNGSFRVDWESSVRYSEMPWKDFLKLKPSEPKLLRIIASKPAAPPPGLPLGNEVIEIKFPGERGVVYAYFNRDEPRFRSLVEQLQVGKWKDVPLTLRLCYPGPMGDDKKVQVAGVEGKGWLILENRRS